MNTVKKLTQNLGLRALFVLGPAVYFRYLIVFFRCLISILRTGDLKPIDRAMGSRPIKVRMNGGEFTVDCPYVDQHIVEGSFIFGNIREIYIKNCYLRYGVSQAAKNARNIVDLGANRGIFSLMMAPRAKLVIAAEFNPVFRDAIAHNMALNGFANYKIETAIIGEGGLTADSKQCRMTILDLLQKYGMESVDVLKMDIEGSEFALFRHPDWLSRVNALCMEVHPEFGDPHEIVTTLKSHGYDVVLTDGLYRPVEVLKQNGHVYAWKPAMATNATSEA